MFTDTIAGIDRMSSMVSKKTFFMSLCPGITFHAKAKGGVILEMSLRGSLRSSVSSLALDRLFDCGARKRNCFIIGYQRGRFGLDGDNTAAARGNDGTLRGGRTQSVKSRWQARAGAYPSRRMQMSERLR